MNNTSNTPFILRLQRVPQGLPILCILIVLMISASALADEVRLRSGDTLVGTILHHNDDQIILEHPDLGRLTISVNAIDSISKTDVTEDSSELQTAETSSDEPTEESNGKETDKASQPEDLWSLGVIFGGSFSNDDEGEKVSFNTRGKAERKTPGLETGISLSYLYKLDNEEVDENNFTGILNQLWLRTESPWLYKATVRYDYDGFRSWRQRIQGHGGAGYRFIDEEELRLWPFVGLGFRKDIDSQEEAFPVEAVTGIEFEWESENHQRLELTTMYFRALNEDEYRLVNTLEWKVPFGRKERLSFNTLLDYEYASNPDPGFPRHNISLTWGLQWDF